MIECVSLMCEMLAILMVIHSLLGRKLVVNVKTITLLAFIVIIYYLINVYRLPVYVQVIVYLSFLVYLRIEFVGENIVKVVGAVFFTVFFVCGMQIPIFYTLKILHFGISNAYIANIVLLVGVAVLARRCDFEKLYQSIVKLKYGMWYIILICGILAILFVAMFKVIGSFSVLETVLFVTIFLIVIICFFQWKAQRDIIVMKEREVRWLAQYNDSFEQLITDVRSRQHEFNSQIDAICGMLYSCTTYEELVKQISMYTEEIFQESRFNRLLTTECPPMIKGFLYYRFCKADESDIVVDYEIAFDSEMEFSVMFDITEIVGILFDNACEALADKAHTKHIFVSGRHMESKICILVENVSSYIAYGKIDLFTKKGYSTKGDARGYGLYNVKKIARKYNGDILIRNIEKAGENWLQISVELPV